LRLRTLQKKGLIQREEHRTDTRAKTVALTDAGKKMIRPAIKTVEAFDKEFFSTLGEEVKHFNTQLAALLNAPAF